MNSHEEKFTFSCVLCNGCYKSERGLKQHYARSSCQAPTHQCQTTQERQSTQKKGQSTHEQELLIPPLNNNEVTHYSCGRYRDMEFEENVTFIYEQIVYWKKNLFLLLTRKTGKLFINELIKLFNALIDDSPLKKIAMKSVMIMPSLLLQNPQRRVNQKTIWKHLIEGWNFGNQVTCWNYFRRV